MNQRRVDYHRANKARVSECGICLMLRTIPLKELNRACAYMSIQLGVDIFVVACACAISTMVVNMKTASKDAVFM